MRLGDLLPDGVSYGIVQPGAEVVDGIPVLRVKDIHDAGVDTREPLRVAPSLAAAFKRTTLRGGELLLTVVGTPGRTAISPPAVAGWNVARAIAVLRPQNANVQWLHYLFKTARLRNQIDACLNTTVQATLNLDDIKKLEIPETPLPEQQAIAEVLGALDDKIAANRALVTTADDLVRTLYQKLPSSSLTISEVATNHREAWVPGNGADLYVGLEHLPRRQMWLADAGVPESATSNKSRFSKGDVLFGKLRPYFHKVVSAPSDGICSTDILVLRARDERIQGLVLAAASSDVTISTCTAASAGTKMPRANWATLSACTVRSGSNAQNLAVSREIMMIRDDVEMRLRESSTLASLRDTLLPALMDGTIRVKDAIAKAEEVL